MKFSFCIHLNSLKRVCIYANTGKKDKNTDFHEFVCFCSVRPSDENVAFFSISFLSCVRREISVFHGISAKHHKKALLIYASNTLLQVSTLQSVSLHIIPLGAVWHRSEDSFWICLHLSVFLLSSITLSLPPSSSPNRCRLVLIDEAMLFRSVWC